ncbi:YheC/YheD family protein [Paenibacillus chartarius]|uniref:YheC/YheD family protein n=1 Tax=Paenibacillus chartarius TaxID=747481 RepID=A0ABV6DV09_9BACL
MPQVVYNRCYSLDPQVLRRVETMIGTNRCFNHITQFNKLDIHNILAHSELKQYVPETASYHDAESASIFNKHPVLYFKPCTGSRGIGVYRVTKMDNGELQLNHHHSAPNVVFSSYEELRAEFDAEIETTPYMIQQGISVQQLHGHNFDLRALVQKNRRGAWSVTNVISRVAFGEYYNTSVCENIRTAAEVLKELYSAVQVEGLLHSLGRISLKAADAIERGTNSHLGEISVDFVLDTEGQLWVVEINGKPEKNLYRSLPDHTDVYKRPLQYAAYLLTRRRSLRRKKS